MDNSDPVIVIIDDDDAVRESLQAFLEISGYSVVGFDCGEDYLNSEIPTPSCLLIDLELHGLNGLMTMEILRDTNRFGPTIIITGTYRNDLLSAAEKSYAHAIIAKPIQPDALAEQINSLIN